MVEISWAENLKSVNRKVAHFTKLEITIKSNKELIRYSLSVGFNRTKKMKRQTFRTLKLVIKTYHCRNGSLLDHSTHSQAQQLTGKKERIITATALQALGVVSGAPVRRRWASGAPDLKKFGNPLISKIWVATWQSVRQIPTLKNKRVALLP